AQLLFRLGIRPVRDAHLAVLQSYRSRVPRAFQRFAAGPVTVFPKNIVIGKALIQDGVALAFGHCLPMLFVEVSKADIFHVFLFVLLGGTFRSPVSRCETPKMDNEK